MRSKRFALSVCLLVLIVPIAAQQTLAQVNQFPSPAALQTQPPTAAQIAQGISMLQQSLAAQTAGAALTDVTLSGTVAVTRSPNTESGAITLTATAQGQFREVMNLPSGTRTEVQDYSVSPRSGTWTGTDGVSHSFLAESLLGAHPAWFFPAFIVQAGLASPDYTKALLGQETKNGATVEHLAIWRQHSGATATGVAVLRHATERDVYLDPSSLLPMAISYNARAFNVNPSVKPYRNIPTYIHREIRFSNYEQVQGLPVPFHIQVYANNTLVFDIQLSSASINTGAVISAAN